MSKPNVPTSSQKRTQPQQTRRTKRTKSTVRTTSQSNKSQSSDTATNDVSTTTPSPEQAASSVQLDRNQPHQHNQVARRSSRTRKATQRLIKAMKSVVTITSEGAIQSPPTEIPNDDANNEIFAFSTLFPDHFDFESDLSILAMKAASDPDTMYFHEAMRMPDKDKFIEAMEKEI